jgi:hypothetical protein
MFLGAPNLQNTNTCGLFWGPQTYRILTLVGSFGAPNLQNTNPCGLFGAPNLQNTNPCGFFRNVFCYSVRKQQFGSLLWGPAVISLIIRGGGPDHRIVRATDQLPKTLVLNLFSWNFLNSYGPHCNTLTLQKTITSNGLFRYINACFSFLACQLDRLCLGRFYVA